MSALVEFWALKVIKRKKEDAIKGKKKYITTNTTSTIVQEEGLTPAKGLRDDLDDQVENDVGQKKRLAFLDLIESALLGAVLSYDDIMEEVDTIMFEANDSGAVGSGFLLSLMGIYHGTQDKVMQEQYEIFGDSDRPVTFQDTLEMKYMDHCILDTLRMFPPGPIITRELQENIKLASSDLIIPAGATAVIGTYKVHRRPDVDSKPPVLYPDKFLPEKAAERHYYSFIPFSAGPISCVGPKYAKLKLKVILSTVLRNYRVHSDLGEKNFKLQADIILKRAEGFMVRLEPRAVGV